jgi:hypothetical protein
VASLVAKLLPAAVRNRAVAIEPALEFHGRDVPVCGIHSAMYARWGRSAEENAERYWGWQA